VQKVREAAARMSCQNNLKQWGTAMHMHHDTYGKLPYGNQRTPRISWVPFLWPYVEQGNLANQYDFKQGFYQGPNGPNGVAVQTIKIYYCPSDRPNAIWRGDTNLRARGNYVVNFGPTILFTANNGAPFGWVSSGGFANYVPYQTRFDQFTDGLSNTMLMAEVRMPPGDGDTDPRGDIMNDRVGPYFNALNTPNSGIDQSSYCNNPPPCPNCSEPTMLCNNSGDQAFAARSRHTGGVNTVFGDASVHFISNNVNLGTWRALSTMNGGEVVGAY